jgi:ribosomal protein L30E
MLNPNIELLKICAGELLQYSPERLSLKLKQITTSVSILPTSDKLFFLVSVNCPAGDAEALSLTAKLKTVPCFIFETPDFVTENDIDTVNLKPFCIVDEIVLTTSQPITLLCFEIQKI